MFILNEYRARQAMERRDQPGAMEHSRLAADAAADAGDNWGYCRMRYQLGELQLDFGLVDDCIDTCEALISSSAVKDFPEFESRTRVLLSRTYNIGGQMEEALTVAREASSKPTQELSAEGRRGVQYVLVAALAEEGDTEAAWTEAMKLVGMLGSDQGARSVGTTHWTVANVAFMSSRIGEGAHHQRLAADALARVNDVNLWAQFNKASAHVRLLAGVNGPETEEFIERAEVAFDVAGGNEIDKYEIRITRAWWELESGDVGKAEELLGSLEQELKGNYPFLYARTLMFLARCLQSQERVHESIRWARESERLFADLGAEVFAAECRQLIGSLERNQ